MASPRGFIPIQVQNLPRFQSRDERRKLRSRLTGTGDLTVAQVDASREEQLLKTALEYIENNRKGTVQIQFIDKIFGKPVSDSQAQYQQTSHDFMFSTRRSSMLQGSAPSARVGGT